MECRKQLDQLQRKRKKLAGKLRVTGLTIKGKLHPVFRACGKPYCKCNKEGKIHKTWAISLRKENKYHSIHIPADILKEVREGTRRYAVIRDLLDEIALLDLEIMKLKHREDKENAKNKRKAP